MKNTFTYLLLSVLFTTSIQAQSLFTIGFKGMVTNDINSVYDDSNLLKDYTEFNFAYSLVLEKEILDHFYIESGLVFKNYTTGYTLNQDYNVGGIKSSSMESMHTIQIPVVAKYKLDIFHFLSFNPNIGYVMLINNSYGTLSTSNVNYGEINVTENINTSFEETFSLVKLGMELELSFNDKNAITLGFGYYKGFKTTISDQIHYKIPLFPVIDGKVTNDGSYFSYSISYLYSL